MSAWEDMPEGNVLEGWNEEEVEAYLRDVFRDLRDRHAERRFHNQDGYLAHEAGSPHCLALGHKPNESGDWEGVPGHDWGWDGDPLCSATRHATACSECESDDCSYYSHDLPPAQFWALFATPKEGTTHD